MPLEILDGAIFIADAHENSKRRDFLYFLKSIEKGAIKPKQLFLMGDIFDLFIGDVPQTHKIYEEYVVKLEAIAKQIPVYYFEGNHDFNLKTLFQYVKVFPISEQPVLFNTPRGKALLLHGDKYCGLAYKLYTSLVRNRYVLKILLFCNTLFFNIILKNLFDKLENKNQCGDIENFEKLALQRVKRFVSEYEDVVGIYEGHYHQNKKFLFDSLVYQNFSSFACDKSYFVVQLASGIKFSQVKLRGKDV